jgi:DNA invertase Pin-like site-specific DNA recombinase
MTRRAAIYCRTSRTVGTDVSREDHPAWLVDRLGALGVNPAAYSPAIIRQLADCLLVADRKSWPFSSRSQIYIDDDVSASAFSRKTRREYLRLLRDIEAGEVFGVISAVEDRTHRQVLELAEFVDLCREQGVLTVTPDAEYDSSDAEQVSTWFMRVRLAQAEVETTSKRLRRRRQQEAERGAPKVGGIRAFGTQGGGRSRVSAERARHERGLIQEAADRVMAGDSLRGIVRDWARRGVATPSGGTWATTGLRKLLLSPRIAGYREHLGTLYPGTWDPIIPPEKWQTVRAILEDPARKRTYGGGAPKYLLTGLVFCGYCGSRLRPQPRRDYGGKVAYRCNACGHVQRLGELLEKLVTEAVFAVVESLGPDQPLLLPARNGFRDLHGVLASDQGLLERLEDKVAQELITEAAARRNRAEIEQRMAHIREHLAALKTDQYRAAEAPRNLRMVWKDLSLDQRREILQAVIERIDVDPVRQMRKGHPCDPRSVRVTWRVRVDWPYASP